MVVSINTQQRRLFDHYTPYGWTTDSIVTVHPDVWLHHNVPVGHWMFPIGGKMPRRLSSFEAEHLTWLSGKCLQALRWQHKHLESPSIAQLLEMAADGPDDHDQLTWHPWFTLISVAARVQAQSTDVLVSIQLTIANQRRRGDIIRFAISPKGDYVRAHKSAGEQANAFASVYPQPDEDPEPDEDLESVPAPKPFLVRI